ncbi:Fc.00g013230.m01.CDS01 [Cosmosporella sp. VM-42]
MESSGPSRPGYPAPRRVATAPIPLSTQFADDSPPSDGIVETLYNHPNVKIISFTASGRAFSRSLGRGSVLPIDDEPGTLSWSSQLERTIAVGPFRIYRAPGSVAFLNCGSALQPILPKSQCWCIDEINSKFILQIRRPNYWRIELPVSDPEDQDRAQNLRVILDHILQFEKTECPFKRSFTVVLPETPKTPAKKRPWAPVPRSLPATPETDPISPAHRSASIISGTRPSTPLNETPDEHDANSPLPTQQESPVQNMFSSSPEVDPQTIETSFELCHGAPAAAIESGSTLAELESVRKNTSLSLEATAWAIENGYTSLMIANYEALIIANYEAFRKNGGFRKSGDVPAPAVESPSEPAAPADDDVLVYELHEGTGYQGERMKTRLRRRAGFGFTRSVTSPPQLSLASEIFTRPIEESTHLQQSVAPHTKSHNSLDKTELISAHDIEEPQHPRRGSEDSFHSVQSWRSPMSPTPLSPPTSQVESLEAFPYPHEDIVWSKHKGLNGYMPDETVISDTRTSWDAASNEGSEASDESVATAPDGTPVTNTEPSLNSTSDRDKGKSTSISDNQRSVRCHRPTTSSISVRRRPLSPLPSAANLFSPPTTRERRRPYQSKLETVKKLPLAIIAKTCEMILGPPSHLIMLMLRVAAKILAGEWRGVVYGYNDSGEQIPVQWDYSEGEFSDWSDDEPYMGSHHGHRPTATDGGPAGEKAESSDDSHTWSVD